jgi:ferredoxin
MERPLHTLIGEKCKGDGICVLACPKDVLEIRDGKARNGVVTRRPGRRTIDRCSLIPLETPGVLWNDFGTSTGPRGPLNDGPRQDMG